MRPESRKYLFDIQTAAASITAFCTGKNFEDYRRDEMLKAEGTAWKVEPQVHTDACPGLDSGSTDNIKNRIVACRKSAVSWES